MKNYYIKEETYGSAFPHIIDEKIMKKAELEMNYLEPDDYIFYCEADSLEEAVEKYWDDFTQMMSILEAEKDHQ